MAGPAENGLATFKRDVAPLVAQSHAALQAAIEQMM
jgi:hypothetical protein